MERGSWRVMMPLAKGPTTIKLYKLTTSDLIHKIPFEHTAFTQLHTSISCLSSDIKIRHANEAT